MQWCGESRTESDMTGDRVRGKLLRTAFWFVPFEVWGSEREPSIGVLLADTMSV